MNSSNKDHKMPVLVVCYKCKQNVDIKRTALCSTCNNRYEPDCDGYPEHTYRLMSQESKKKWRCTHCIRKKTTKSTEPSNITMRKKPMYSAEKTPQQTKKKQSPPDQDSHVLTDNDTSFEIDSTPNQLSKSVDGTITNISSMSEMQDTIDQLTIKLESTENELENTILENNDLKRQVNKMTQEIIVLKSLCHSSTTSKVGSPLCNEKKKRHSLLSQNVSSTPCSPRLTTNIEPNNKFICIHLQQNITALQKKLQIAENEIKTLNTQIEVLKQSLRTTPEPQPEQILSANTFRTYPTASRPKRNTSGKTIRIFGAQQCIGLAAALIDSRQTTQYEKYGVLAHTMPNAQSDIIIKSCINIKLQPDDIIVISLGENDYNMGHVLSQLKIVIKTFYKNSIIILSVLKNSHLDVDTLNYRIKNICKHYKNCHFMNSMHHNVLDVSKSINYILDCDYYNQKYLNPVMLKKHLASSKSSSLKKKETNIPKKGTIPFYFRNRNSSGTIQNVNSHSPSKEHKKGTIPYYFPTLSKKDTFFRT